MGAGLGLGSTWLGGSGCRGGGLVGHQLGNPGASGSALAFSHGFGWGDGNGTGPWGERFRRLNGSGGWRRGDCCCEVSWC